MQMNLNLEGSLDQRIADALDGRGPRKMEPKEKSLLQWMQMRRGRDRAVRISAIAPVLNLTERDVKGAVKTLIEEFGIPIGGARQEPCGYFLIVTAEDMADAIRPLMHEIESMVLRIKALKGAQGAIDALRAVEQLTINSFEPPSDER